MKRLFLSKVEFKSASLQTGLAQRDMYFRPPKSDKSRYTSWRLKRCCLRPRLIRMRNGSSNPMQCWLIADWCNSSSFRSVLQVVKWQCYPVGHQARWWCSHRWLWLKTGTFDWQNEEKFWSWHGTVSHILLVLSCILGSQSRKLTMVILR